MFLTKPASRWAAVVLLAAFSSLTPSAQVNAQTNCECCPGGLPLAPNNQIDFALSWTFPPTPSDSFMTATVFGNSALATGVYASWCADAQTSLLPGTQGYEYSGRVYASTDPTLNSFISLETSNTNALVGPEVWHQVSYLLNHRTAYNYWDVQAAIWHFVGGPAVTSPPYPGFNQAAIDQMISDTISNAAAWCPQAGDKMPVVVALNWPQDNQILILEMPCPGTTPSLAIAISCPTDCGLAEFSGSVSNSGNVTLANVLVHSSQPADNTLVLGPISLAPGTAATFAGSYVIPCITNLSTNLVNTVTTNLVSIITTNTAGLVTTNLNSVITTNVVFTVQTNLVSVVTTNVVSSFTTNTVSLVTTNTVIEITTTNTVTITTNNTGGIPAIASLSTFGTITPTGSTGAVMDRFQVGTNFHGLTYSDSDHGYGATKFYSIRHDSAASANFFDTIAPTGATGTITDRFTLPAYNYDFLAYAAPDVGYGPTIFYYLRHDATGASYFGSITPGGVVGVAADHKLVGTNFDALTFSATDVGYGANLFYYVRHDANCNSIFGTIDPAQGGPVTDRFSVGENVDALVFASTDVGYGADNFYYLRHDSTGHSTLGTIFVTGLTIGAVTDRFSVGTNVVELSFTTTDVLYGPDLFYYLRGMPKVGCAQTTFTTNTATTSLTNSVLSFTTNEVSSVTTNNVVSFDTNTVTSFLTNSVTTLTTNTVTSTVTNTLTSYSTNSVADYVTNTVSTFTTNIIAAAITNIVTASGVDICQSRTVTASDTCSVFPSQPVPLMIGGAGIPQPRILNGNFSWSFATVEGQSYTVQFKAALDDASWTDLETVTGTGGTLSVSHLVNGQESGFYRLKLISK